MEAQGGQKVYTYMNKTGWHQLLVELHFRGSLLYKITQEISFGMLGCNPPLISGLSNENMSVLRLIYFCGFLFIAWLTRQYSSYAEVTICFLCAFAFQSNTSSWWCSLHQKTCRSKYSVNVLEFSWIKNKGLRWLSNVEVVYRLLHWRKINWNSEDWQNLQSGGSRVACFKRSVVGNTQWAQCEDMYTCV